MPLGIYISVPFCRSKCTYCNFASGVFPAFETEGYIERLGEDLATCRPLTRGYGAEIPDACDSVYLGGGTPSLLQPIQLKKLFFILRNQFAVSREAEMTVECAPGTLSDEIIGTLAACGVNRVSLGVQSFVDQEAASVARLHTREKTLCDIERLREAGISNINLDLIAGLPHQTLQSWGFSLEQAVSTGVSHISVYMLEIDEDSRLGRELIAGGTKYHAHFVPDEDLIAEFYEIACSTLSAAGIEQYEISNFARAGCQSRHNLKYWTRQPYLGFGLDAHSMLPSSATLRSQGTESVRMSTTDSLDQFFASAGWKAAPVSAAEALEERFFLGLRLNRGVALDEISHDFGVAAERFGPAIEELVASGLLGRDQTTLRLTPRGRLLSNEVFEKFIATVQPVEK
jgi:oxygen-independent coproporphyrinogen-3 oxidase